MSGRVQSVFNPARLANFRMTGIQMNQLGQFPPAALTRHPLPDPPATAAGVTGTGSGAFLPCPPAKRHHIRWPLTTVLSDTIRCSSASSWWYITENPGAMAVAIEPSPPFIVLLSLMAPSSLCTQPALPGINWGQYMGHPVLGQSFL